MPLPWIAMLAGVLANKMGAEREKKSLGTQIRRNQAQKMGGDTRVLDAMLGRKEIEGRESDNMSNMFIQQLVGQLGQKPKDNTTPVTSGNGQLGGTIGGTGLMEPQGPYDPMNQATAPMYGGGTPTIGPDEEEIMRRGWRK